MFDFNKNQKTPTDLNKIIEPETLQKNPATETAPAFDATNVRVHTMPDKFLTGGSKKITTTGMESISSVSGHKKNIIIGVVIGVLIVALIALGAWFLLKSLEQPVVNNEPVAEEPIKQEEVAPVVEEVVNVCSADNCSACTVETCQDFSESCYVTDACLNNSSAESTCPDFICVSGVAPVQATSSDETENLILLPAKDSDNDLLTDTEEGLWGTDPLKMDTDGDKYNDGAEVKNLYSPIVAGSDEQAKLIGSKLVKEFVNNKFGYTVYYPSSWLLEDLKNNSEEIMFKANNDEFVEVIIEPLVEEYASAKDWYLSVDSNIQESDLQEVLIGNWSGVKSPDGLSVYLIRNNILYALTYNVGLNTELTFQTTFEMMLKTFKFFESPLN